MAGAGRHAAGGRGHRGRRRALGAVGVRAVQQRLRLRHRRLRRPDGRRAGPSRRRSQPRQAGAEGPVRVVAVERARPAHPASRARGRGAGRNGLGHGHGARGAPFHRPAARGRPALPRLLHHGPALPRGVLHPRRAGQGRARHTAHGRQHPVVHRHGRRRDEGELRLGRPARQLHRHRRLRHAVLLRAQHGRDTDGAVGAGARPDRRCRPAARGRRRSAPHPGRRSRRADRRRAPRPAAGDQPGADERAGPRDHRERVGRPGLRRRAHGRLRRSRRAGARVHPRARGRTLRCHRRRGPRRGQAVRHRGPGTVHSASGVLPVAPGHGRVLPGQQPAPADRAPRLTRQRGVADERPADRTEHAGVRRGRRPARIPQLAQPGPRARAGRAVEGRPADHPALVPADARHADLALRRAGLDPLPVDLGHEPRRVAAGTGARARDPAPRGAVRGGAGRVPHRDRRIRRRGPARRAVGRETGLLHQRQPHGPPFRQGRGPARRGSRRSGHFPRLRTPDGPSQRRGRPVDPMARPGERVRGVEGVHAREVVRLHRPFVRAAARTRYPVAVRRRAPRRLRPPLHRRRVPHRPRSVRDVRARPGHRRRDQPRTVQGGAAGRPCVPAGGAVQCPARDARRATSLRLRDRAHRLPLPHAHQNRAVEAAERGRATPLGGTLRRRRGTARGRRGRRGACRQRSRGARPARARGQGPRWRRVRPVPLRLLGHGGRLSPGRAPARGERVDPHGVGPGVQAAVPQGRRGLGDPPRPR